MKTFVLRLLSRFKELVKNNKRKFSIYEHGGDVYSISFWKLIFRLLFWKWNTNRESQIIEITFFSGEYK